jgi:hypothetical protein
MATYLNLTEGNAVKQLEVPDNIDVNNEELEKFWQVILKARAGQLYSAGVALLDLIAMVQSRARRA